MTVYAIHAMISTHVGDYQGSRAVPLFYLDSDVQGIMSATHACEIAATVLNPLGLIPAADVHASAFACTPGSPARQYTHIVKRASGAVAGWCESAEYAQGCADECNRLVPGDRAHVELLQGDEAWDLLLAAEHADAVAASPAHADWCAGPSAHAHAD